MTLALLGALLGGPEDRASALAKKEGWHAAFLPPLPGSLKENVRRWLMMDVGYDGERKSNCICPEPPHPPSVQPYRDTVNSAVLSRTVQMCGLQNGYTKVPSPPFFFCKL
ncbi:hypothetical protein PBY51_007164 [Eleginops maclovinus]|nr:hypothetical protein PBY51_007164 [Eleginops maclovinus]